MFLTDRLDLRGGRNCWQDAARAEPSDVVRDQAEVVVIGAGIMGAMVSERLAQRGLDVLVLDHRVPATGATAASTALVMWGADIPLTHLARTVGREEAIARWRSVFEAVSALDSFIRANGIECGWAARPELYLAGSVLDPEAIAAEGEFRRGAGLPSEFVKAGAVSERFGVVGRAGLVSNNSYEVNPVALTRGLLKRARLAPVFAIRSPSNASKRQTMESTSFVRTACGSGRARSCSQLDTRPRACSCLSIFPCPRVLR